MIQNYLPKFVCSLLVLFLIGFNANASVNSISLTSDEKIKENPVKPYLPFFVEGVAEVQLIHNAPDPTLSEVDIYVNDELIESNFSFRTATAFLTLPAGEDLDIAIAIGGSTSSASAFFNTTLNLTADEKYVVVANGVQQPNLFDTSVNSSIAFNLDVFPGAREVAVAVAGNTDILIHHGATDLANFDLDEITVPIPNFVSDLAYTNFQNYVQIATNLYSIQPVLTSTQEEFEVYDLPLSDLNLQNKAVTLLTSGFVDIEANQNGPEFGLWLAQPEGGDLIELPFQGECVSFSTPFTEDFSGSEWQAGSGFQNSGDSIDECWARTPDNIDNVYAWGTGNSNSNLFNSGPSSAFQGTKFIYTKQSGSPGAEAVFTSPVINTNGLDSPALSFYYFMYGFGIDSFSVEVQEFGTESWTNLITINGQQQTSEDDDWLEEEIELAGLENKKIQLRFIATRGSNFNSVVALDLIEVREATTCLKPTNLNITQIGDTSAQINWNTQSNPVDWFVYASGANPDTATPIQQSSESLSANNGQVTGLSANTTYDVYIQSNCGDDGLSQLTGPVEFTTAACAVSEQCEFTFNLLDDFGDGWTGNIVELRQDGQLVANLGADFDDGDNFTETYNLCTGSSIELIWLNQGSFPNEVGLNVVNPFDEEIFELEFDSEDERGNTIFSFTSGCTPPSCPKVTNVQVTNVVDDAAQLNWNAEPEANLGYTWYIFNAGANPLTASPFLSESVGQSINSVNITGLSSAQEYDAYVVANCGTDDDSDFSDVVTFNTACGTITAPYLEDFSGSEWVSGTGFFNTGDEINQCWDRETNGYFWGARTGATGGTSSGPNSAFLGENYIYAVGPSGNNGQTATITSPQIDLANLTNPGITFFYFMRGNSIGELAIEVKSVNSSNWVELENIVGAQQTDVDDNWEEVVVSLNAFQGEVIEYRFVATRGNSFSSDIALDAIEVAEVNPCLRPKDLEIDNIDIDGAELSWTPADANANGFIWEIYLDGTDPENATPVAEGTTPSNTTTAVITGLDADTTYLAYVIAECDEDEFSNRSIPLTFSTLVCDASETCEYTFELFDSFGDGWNGNTMSVLQNGVEVAVLGEGFTSGNNFTETVNLCNDATIELFWNDGGGFAFEVGVTILNPFDEEVYEKNPGEGSQNTSLFTFTSDCDSPDGCFPPLNFDLVEVTTDSVELSWDNIGSAISGYNWFIFNAADNPQNTSPVANGSTNFEVNSVLVSGLAENTDYKAFIRSDCGFTGVSSASDPLFFKTPCNPLDTPYLVDFESSDWSPQNSGDESIGDCWSRNPEFELGTYSWLAFSDNFINNPIGNNFIIITNQFGNSGDQAIIELPALDLSNLEDPSLNYFYLLTGNNVGTYDVEIKEVSSDNWTNLKTYTEEEQNNLSDDFEREIFDLAAFENQTVNIRFVATRSAGSSIFFAIDDLRVDELPVCNAPLNLNVSNVQTDSALLSFDEDESAINGYDWFVYLNGDDPETDNAIISGNSSSELNIALDNLSPATTYDVYVQSSCLDSEVSDLSIPVTFSTEVCEEEDKCAYTYSLSSDSGNGWNGATMQVFQDGILVATLGESFNTEAEFDEVINLCQDVNTELVWNEAGSASADVNISITDPFNEEIYNSSSESITPGEMLFSFTSNCTPPICPDPTNVEVSDVTQTTASISWEETDATQLSYNWFVFLAGDNPEVDNPVAEGTTQAGELSVTVSDLTLDTAYQVYVQAECEFSESELTLPVDFTTFGTCEAPENVFVSDITTDGVTINWDLAVNANNGYNWFVFEAGDDPEADAPVNSGVAANGEDLVAITGLEEETDYDVYVQSDCDVVQSDLSSVISFTTFGQCNAPQNITLVELSYTSVEFSWDEVSNANLGYTWFVFIAGDNPEIETPIDSGSLSQTENSVLIQNLEQNIEYDFYVKADCELLMSDFSTAFTFTTEFCPPPPNDLQFDEITQTTASFSWSAASGNALNYAYVIHNQGEGPDILTAITNSPAYDTNATTENLEPNTTYDVYIRSHCGGQNFSEYIGPFTFTTLNPECEAPSDITITNISPDQITLTWSEVELATNGYFWYIFDGSDVPEEGTALDFGSVDSGETSVVIDGLTENTTYQVVLESDCSVNFSEFSEPIVFTTENLACETPDNFEVSLVTDTSATLSWEAITDDTENLTFGGYTWFIYNAGDIPGVDTPAFTSTTEETSVDLDNLNPETNYEAYVQANCDTGDSNLPPPFAFSTTDALNACQPAQNIIASNISQTSIFLNWDPPADSPVVEYTWEIRETVTGFPIYATDDVGPSITEIAIDGLEPNTSYLANVVTDCGTQFTIPGDSFAFTTLDATELPPNDDICNPTFIPEFISVIGDNTNATVQINEPTPSCFEADIESTVWFSYVAPSSNDTDILIQSINNSGTADVAVYEEPDDCTDLTSLVEVACGVGTGTNGESIFSPSALNQGETYYIQVSFDAEDEGTFEIFLESNLSNQDFNKLQISLYPNPASHMLNVEAPESIEDIIIYNMLGQQVYKQKHNQNSVAVPVSNLESGQYFAKVIIDGKTYVEAFIKK